MEWTCLKCGADNESDWSFGDDVTCEKCGTIHETDYELDEDLGCNGGWVTSIKNN